MKPENLRICTLDRNEIDLIKNCDIPGYVTPCKMYRITLEGPRWKEENNIKIFIRKISFGNVSWTEEIYTYDVAKCQFSEGRALYNHCYENLKSLIFLIHSVLTTLP
jgi:hypothetical protein